VTPGSSFGQEKYRTNGDKKEIENRNNGNKKENRNRKIRISSIRIPV
jgi:hypothetical protein